MNNVNYFTDLSKSIADLNKIVLIMFLCRSEVNFLYECGFLKGDINFLYK